MSEERKFELEVITRLTTIETILRGFEGIEQKANHAYELSLRNKERLDKMEDNSKWMFRTTIGAVITGLIAILLSFIR